MRYSLREHSTAKLTVTRRQVLRWGGRAVLLGGAGWLAGDILLDAPSTVEFWAHDFGAVGDGRTDDGPAIRRMFQRASRVHSRARVRFRPGTYRVGAVPDASYAVTVAGARELQVDAQDATLVVTQPWVGGIRFDRCDNCVVSGLSVDYDPLPHALGLVRGIRRRERLIDAEFSADLPMPDAPFFTFALPGDRHPTSFGVVFDRATGILKPSTPDHVMVERAQRLGGQLYRLRTRQGTLSPDVTVGDLLVYPVRQHGNALAFFDTPGAIVADVQIFAANAAAIALIRSDAARITGTTVAPPNGAGRLFSTNGDGVHAQDCRVGPAVERCRFEGMLDDGLNVYNRPFIITGVSEDVEFELSGGRELRDGDVVQFFEPLRGRSRGTRLVALARPDHERNTWRVRLDRPVPGTQAGPSYRIADTVFNVSASGGGVSVRNTDYRRHRGFSTRIQAERGDVSDNTFSEIGSGAIVLANNADWPEGPPPAGITVVRNHLDQPNTVTGATALDVGARALGHTAAEELLVHTVLIEDNVIRRWRGSALSIAGARDVVVRGNRFEAPTHDGTRTSAVRIRKASRVRVEELTVVGDVPVAVRIDPGVASGEEHVQIDRVRGDPGTIAIQDQR